MAICSSRNCLKSALIRKLSSWHDFTWCGFIASIAFWCPLDVSGSLRPTVDVWFLLLYPVIQLFSCVLAGLGKAFTLWTQLGWAVLWDPDRIPHESMKKIHPALFTGVNILLQSHDRPCRLGCKPDNKLDSFEQSSVTYGHKSIILMMFGLRYSILRSSTSDSMSKMHFSVE